MIQLFVVFHKYIFDDCYKNIPDHILKKYFTFIAVNPNIEKKYTPNKYKVINEWELPVYDKTFQERGYNENSAIYHIYANDLHKDYDYVGFFQYDMVFQNNIVDYLRESIISGEKVYFTPGTSSFYDCSYLTWNEPNTLHYILNDYETFFNVKIDQNKMFPLLNTYVLPTYNYEKIMKWVVQLYDKLYPWCVQPPNKTHFAHIGGIYERIMAYAVGNEDLIEKPIHLKHDQNNYKYISY